MREEKFRSIVIQLRTKLVQMVIIYQVENVFLKINKTLSFMDPGSFFIAEQRFAMQQCIYEVNKAFKDYQ